ncbi:nitrite reductase small subunit NirD [Corynebacterium sp.]|uniref:nitrite reductase small subunit NirD n=1 Tax=Corynebacterium sp. TaxID=1720 RepID=UPI003734EE1D
MSISFDASKLEENLGVAVLMPNDEQVAVYLVGGELYALSNIDPYSRAAVMSRGIIGEHEGRPTVASPMLKQKFYLDDGTSLQEDDIVIQTYPVKRDGEQIIVG